MDTLTLNVSGKQFKIGKATANRLPDTKIGRLTQDDQYFVHETGEYFFDRNPKMILPILDLYRTGQLHLPCSLCTFAIKAELEFWEINESMISECCWKRYSASLHDSKAVDVLVNAMSCDHVSEQNKILSLRERLWVSLEYPNFSLSSKIWFSFYLLMVFVTVISSCISVSPDMREPIGQSATNAMGLDNTTLWTMLLTTDTSLQTYYLELICLAFFTAELSFKFMVSPTKWEFCKRPLNVMDLILTAIMWVSVIIDHIPAVKQAPVIHAVFRALLCFNVLRIFHMGRSFHGVKMLFFTLTDSIQAFGLLLVSMTMAVVIYATIAYFGEMLTRADSFENIPLAIWWVVVTMTTVGYGDFVPHSWPGYCVGTVCAFSGVLILALPIAIIASNFNTYYSNMSSAQQRMRRKKIILPRVD